jgi:hypothetical protein
MVSLPSFDIGAVPCSLLHGAFGYTENTMFV